MYFSFTFFYILLRSRSRSEDKIYTAHIDNIKFIAI